MEKVSRLGYRLYPWLIDVLCHTPTIVDLLPD